MAQRCSYCGRTEKQHGGVACIDLSGFHRKALPGHTPFDVTCNRLRAIIADLEADPVQQILTPEEKNQLSGVVNITEVRINAIMSEARKRTNATP